VTTRQTGTGEEDAIADAAGGEAAPAGDGGTYVDDAGGEEAAPRRRGARRPTVGWSGRAVASAALLLLAVCWLPPYLAQRAGNAALDEAGDGRVQPALEQARHAARLDPLAVSPLLTEATLLQQLGQNRAALERLEEATRLQPQNFEVWYALGELQQGVLGRPKDARASFARALALNPTDAASRYELDRLAY
jgi:tetratricopeptide (TPR) repeat protein